jgi:short-subunit dehydrogenase
VSSALVTGATAGIGWAYARELAAHGLDVVLVARDAERLERRARELREAYAVAVEVLVADLADREQLRTVEARLSDPDRPPVSWLVNNAGFGLATPFGESDVRDEERALDVMVRAVLVLTKAALPGMVERGSGVVVNVSSVAGFLRNGTYSAAKAWVTAFTEGLVPQVRGTGVRVQALCPGLTRTEFHARSGEDVSKVPDVAWMSPEDVVRASVRAVARGAVVCAPGWQNAALPVVARLVPRSLLLRMHR